LDAKGPQGTLGGLIRVPEPQPHPQKGLVVLASRQVDPGETDQTQDLGVPGQRLTGQPQRLEGLP